MSIIKYYILRKEVNGNEWASPGRKENDGKAASKERKGYMGGGIGFLCVSTYLC